MSRLELYVQGWREAAADLRALLAELADDDWLRPTDCPGWTVRDVLAHLVAIEQQLAGTDTLTAAVDTAGTGGSVVTPSWTQPGVLARRDRAAADLLADFDAALAEREAQLAVDLPGATPDGRPSRAPEGLTWDWETLLRNRTIDMWVHGQDVRRAVQRPGGLDNLGAAVSVGTFAMSLPYVLGKRVRPPVGTSVVWQVNGAHPATIAVGIDEHRRAVQLPEPPAAPTATLDMDTETFACLAAGRRDPTTAAVTVAGDAELAARTLAAMAVTP